MRPPVEGVRVREDRGRKRCERGERSSLMTGSSCGCHVVDVLWLLSCCCVSSLPFGHKVSPGQWLNFSMEGEDRALKDAAWKGFILGLKDELYQRSGEEWSLVLFMPRRTDLTSWERITRTGEQRKGRKRRNET